MPRKRVFDEVDAGPLDDSPAPTDPLLLKLRNMWEFANLMQYIYIFGSVVKISKDVDIDALEMECCKPGPSELLSQMGLALLKFVSSHRGLTPDLFDEYTRRQYDAKASKRPNPFGADEEPLKFTDFDVFTKIRVLHQLSVWTLWNPDRIRQALANENERSWYIEPFGWDSQDRTYFSLDDNRLYRMTEPALPQPPKKKPPKTPKKPPPKITKGSRSSKRQKLANGVAADDEDIDDNAPATPSAAEDALEPEEPEVDPGLGLGGAKWECVAITLQEYKDFTESIRKSKDPNEKELYKRMQEDMLPVINELAAAQERKAAARRRELENLQRLATAKRSSRIADKHEKQKEQEEAEELERKRQEELAAARKEEAKQRKIEEARESRMITREQRLKDRELKRIQHEEELARLEALSQDGDSAEARISERRRKNEVERKKRELEQWKEEDEEWYFDCSICGVHGRNWDDGTHSIACDKCNVWQHSACHGINEEQAESDEFHFVCSSCLRPPKPPKPIKLNMSSATSTPEAKKKRKKHEPKQAQVNGESPQQEPKKRKYTPKAQRPQTNGFSPTLMPYESIMEPIDLIPNSSSQSNLQPPFYPTQGHFPPPTNGHTPKAAAAQFGSSSSAQLPHSNGVRLNNASNITWQHYSPSHFRNDHNPFLNDFGRQRMSPNAHQATPHISSRPHLSPPNSNIATSRTEQSQSSVPQTPLAAQLPPIAASPTPSFSATQGNTTVRFSQVGDHSNHTGGFGSESSSNLGAFAGSNPAAVSPIKHSSSPAPPLPQSSSQGYKNTAIETGVPNFQSPPTASQAGLSPVKHDAAPVLPHPPSSHNHHGHGHNLASAETPTPYPRADQSAARLPFHPSAGSSSGSNIYHNTLATSTTSAAAPRLSPTIDRGHQSHPTGQAQLLHSPVRQSQPQPDLQPTHVSAVPPAPTLSPSVGLSGANISPEKKDLPKSPPLHAQRPNESSSAQHSVLPPAPTLSPSVGLSSENESPEKKERPKSPPQVHQRTLDTDSVQPVMLPPGPKLTPNIGLSSSMDTLERREMPQPPQASLESLPSPRALALPGLKPAASGNVVEDAKTFVGPNPNDDQHREVSAGNSQNSIPNGVPEVAPQYKTD